MTSNLRVRYTEAARAELRDIHAYISHDNPMAAAKVVTAIEATVLLLSQFPWKSRKTRVRDWHAQPVSRYPYIVFFRIKRDELEILHIRHGARRHPGFQDEQQEFVAERA